MTKAGESTKNVVYSAFNTPTSITQGSKFSTLVYGPNQDRIKHSDSNGRVTKYVGGIYEEVTKGGITQKLHYVGDFAIFVQTDGVTPTNKHEYLHRDHIGSVVAISNEAANSASDIQWQANGAWGERRFEQWNGPQDLDFVPTSTARGFTDHEQLDAVGLIHMNGRVYDPELGRFLSADPYVQAPYNTQSYNRYAYVFNNPLSFTDPTGYEAICGDPNPDGNLDPNGVVLSCNNTSGEWIDTSPGSDYWYYSDLARQTEEQNRLTDQFLSYDYAMRNVMRDATAQEIALIANQKSLDEFNDGISNIFTATLVVADAPNLARLIYLGGRLSYRFGADLLSKQLAKVATNNAPRVFWSGGNEAKSAAEAFAKANGGVTLEMTSAGKNLEKLTKGMDWSEAKPLWEAASREFAEGAKGAVNVFQSGSRGVSLESVWGNIEYPVLKQQGNDIIYNVTTQGGVVKVP